VVKPTDKKIKQKRTRRKTVIEKFFVMPMETFRSELCQVNNPFHDIIEVTVKTARKR